MFFFIFSPSKFFFSVSGLLILEIPIFSLFFSIFSVFSAFKFCLGFKISDFFRMLAVSDFRTRWKTSLLFFRMPVFDFFKSKCIVLLFSHIFSKKFKKTKIIILRGGDDSNFIDLLDIFSCFAWISGFFLLPRAIF